MSKTKKQPSADAMESYIREIDRFASLLRDEQQQINVLSRAADRAKSDYELAKDAVREAKEQEHNTVSLLLKFIRPGSIDIMPLSASIKARTSMIL